MPYNGSGTFTRIYSWVTDAANGIFVSSSRMDTDTNDIVNNGLSNCVTRDGQSPPTANLPMGTFKLTGLGAGLNPGDSVRFEQLAASLPYGLCEGRLTLTSGTPVTTSDVTAAETVYFTPYRGNRIALFSSGAWAAQTFLEISVDVPDVTSMHDVFAYNNSGAVTLEVLAWTNDTTRATALTTQNGVLVKSGDATRRYLGSFYCTTAGNGQTEDSRANRYLWNYYNRVVRPLFNRDASTLSYAYTSTTIRQANADTDNQLNMAIGVAEDMVSISVSGAFSSTSAAVVASIGIGIGATNSYSTTASSIGVSQSCTTTTSGAVIPLTASLITTPSVGKQFYSWNESGGTNGTFYNSYDTGKGFCAIYGQLLG